MDLSSVLHKEMGTNNSFESMLVCSKAQQDRKPRPPQEQPQKCPRCDSLNTKFCYYNNYSLTQPRYFCKSCRRYWTKGGTLRNVPVGGGCRKNKRSSSLSERAQKHQPLMITNGSNSLSNLNHSSYDCNDLSVAFARLQKQSNGQLGFDHDHMHQLSILGNSSLINNNHYDNHHHHGFLANFHENPNGNFQNMFHGGFGSYNGNNNNIGDEMIVPFDQDFSRASTPSMATISTMKQDIMCNNGDGDNNRVLWGFPYQIGSGDHNGINVGDNQNWNGGSIAPSWHGLLNSPLM